MLQVLLVLLATSAQILKPFLRTPTRVVTTVLLITVLVLAVRQWGEIKVRTLRASLGINLFLCVILFQEFSVNFASKVKNVTDKDQDL